MSSSARSAESSYDSEPQTCRDCGAKQKVRYKSFRNTFTVQPQWIPCANVNGKEKCNTKLKWLVLGEIVGGAVLVE